MANAKKKISELTSLGSASLDTVVVGVDNGTTYKIELDVLADGVRDRINTLDDVRLTSLESFTSSVNNTSLNAFTASHNAWSGGVFLTSSFNSFSSSVHTEILAATNEQNLGYLATTSSVNTLSQSLNVVSNNVATIQSGFDTASYQSFTASINVSVNKLNTFTASVSTASLVTSINNLNSFTASVSTASLVTSINNLNSATSSYETNGRGIVSGSSQLTSSFDIRYTLSGSVSVSPNTISSSAQITALGFVSTSVDLTSLNNFTSSYRSGSFSGSFTGSVSGTANNANFSTYVLTQNSNTNGDFTFLFAATGSNGYLQTYTDGVPGVLYNPSINKLTVSGSFETISGSITGRIAATNNVLSSSAQLTVLGFATTSSVPNVDTSSLVTSITNLNTFTASISTASLVTSINNLNSFTASQSTASIITSITNLNTFTASISTASLVTSISNLNTFTASVSTASLVISINNLNTETASLETRATSLATITGSLITTASSYETRFTTLSTITSSLQTQLTTIGGQSGSWSGGGSLTSLNAFSASILTETASIETRLATIGGQSGSWGGAASLTSLNSFTASQYVSNSYFATTGSTTFSGSLYISGSEMIGSGAFDVTAPEKLLINQSGSSYNAGAIKSNVNNYSQFYITNLSNGISASSDLVVQADNGSQTNMFADLGVNSSGYTGNGNGVGAANDAYVYGKAKNFWVGNNTTSSLYIFANTTGTPDLILSSSTLYISSSTTIQNTLTINTGTVISSSLTAASSSLTLNSGSNFYLQNNGIAQITGSLSISGSTTLTGSFIISSGSITMPDRPAFKVVGAGSSWGATRTLSGSAYTLDFQQGSGWDTSTGIFTAPIAGLYQVNLVGRAYSNTGVMSQIIVYKTTAIGAVTTTQIMIEWAANTTANHIGGSSITKMAVGDTLKAVVAAGSCSFDGNDNFSVAYIG